MFRISRSYHSLYAFHIDQFWRTWRKRTMGAKVRALHVWINSVWKTMVGRKCGVRAESGSALIATNQQFVLKTASSAVGYFSLAEKSTTLGVPVRRCGVVFAKSKPPSDRISLYFLWELGEAYLVPKCFAALTTNPLKIITPRTAFLYDFPCGVSLCRHARTIAYRSIRIVRMLVRIRYRSRHRLREQRSSWPKNFPTRSAPRRAWPTSRLFYLTRWVYLGRLGRNRSGNFLLKI